MRPGMKTALGTTLIVPALLIVSLGRQVSYGDEPSRLGRLFRFGGGSSASAPASRSPAAPSANAAPSALPFSSAMGATSSFGAPATAAPRIVPQPRVSRPATESDPIVTRISLARSNDGNQFGMFLQVYADGTVIDSEGVQHLSAGDLKPVTDALAVSDLYRLKGHCGAPATDFVEQVHLVVYERSLGRLRANAFSYSGNPQGCDHAVRHLHTALDGLQAKLSRTAAPAAAGAGVPSPAPAEPLSTGSTIPLTPIN
jgi:hypothetical protein